MNWTEITAEVPVERSDEAAAIANMTVPYGIYIEDYSDLEQSAWDIAHIDLIDKELTEKDRSKAIIHIYISECDNPDEAIAFLSERMAAAGIDFKVNRERVDDSDWSENWKKYFKAFDVGKRLAVRPSWESYDNKDNRTVVNIDPGAAFGTGTHATTYLCMSILENHVKSGDKALDIGTGSGILAITSLLLGAESAIGVDIDAQSVKTAGENAGRNGVAEKCEFICGDLADKVSGKYEIVCANIVADVIIRLFENVAQFMQENGVLIISGIIDMRSADVEAAARAHGFEIAEAHERDEWRAYVLKTMRGDN